MGFFHKIWEKIKGNALSFAINYGSGWLSDIKYENYKEKDALMFVYFVKQFDYVFISMKIINSNFF